MKLTIAMKIDRPDGKHSGVVEFEIDDDVLGDPVAAMAVAFPISAEILDGIIFLIMHTDAEDGAEPAKNIKVPEAFRRAFD
jgi:hypothetical protein